MSKALNLGLLAGMALATLATASNAQIIRPAGYDANILARNDDGSTGFVNFGLGNLNFFGQTVTGGWVNNNGNVTLDTPGNGPLSTFTPLQHHHHRPSHPWQANRLFQVRTGRRGR